ncbi:MAG: GTPase Era [Bacteroidetes bacterium]|nr:GTPase Era [Bacteroidota bacterium]
MEDEEQKSTEASPQSHKAGFINILGKPNVGKSTLMNALVGERVSIITSKAQTTRHRILGIVNGDDFQMVFSDTPGIIKPNYKMQESMMSFVRSSLEDADVFLYIVEIGDKMEKQPREFEKIMDQTEVPVLLLLNKKDLMKDAAKLEAALSTWKVDKPHVELRVISALDEADAGSVFDWILDRLPLSPPYYPKDALTDKPERFFMEEIVREKILLNYKQEIPYSCEVVIESFKEEEAIIRIRAEIYVNRKSQKPILIGKGGSMLKKVGTEARIEAEKFFGKKIYLELFVKVKENWRDSDSMLKRLGYRG